MTVPASCPPHQRLERVQTSSGCWYGCLLCGETLQGKPLSERTRAAMLEMVRAVERKMAPAP